MKIEAFFNSWLPNVERKRVVEDLDQLREEIDKTLLPKLKESAALQGGRKFASSYAINFESLFLHALPEYRTRGFLVGAQGLMENIRANLVSIEKLVPDWFAKDITKESVTYPKASLLQYIQMSSFAVDYTLRVLYRLVAAEANQALGGSSSIEASLTPAEKNWFTNNESAYFNAIAALNVRNADFAKLLEKIPQINIVPENADLIRETVAASSLDPFRFGFVAPTSWNPFYQIRLVHAEAQVRRYRMKLEERRALEFRLLQWKEAQAGKNDAKLAQEIEYSEGRLQRLNYDISELQERYSKA